MAAPEQLELLARGDLEIEGRMPWSSNGTFLVALCLDGVEARAIYKPRRGERPLWDFPEGLYKREVAAFEVSDALGWDIVPPTVVRDGPLGVGSLQWFVDAEFEQHYFTFQDDERYHADLHAICAFDILTNNTDRKSGHCLLTKEGRIIGIDHGLSFHEDYKLRTVIWDFGDEPIPDDLLADLEAYDERDGYRDLEALLDEDELAAMRDRARMLLTNRVFPTDPSGRRYPWPLV